jgi:hypothetical protein
MEASNGIEKLIKRGKIKNNFQETDLNLFNMADVVKSK